MQTAGLSQVL